MSWRTSTTLLDALLSSEAHRSWERIVEHFRQPIALLGRKMGLSPEDAEDAAQESLIACANSLRNGRYRRSEGRLNQWLFGIARRQIRNTRRETWRKKAGQFGARTSFWSNLPQQNPNLLGADDEPSWEQTVLQACEERVRAQEPPVVIAAFDSIVYGKKKPAEVARQLGVTVKWVYNAKHRVLKRIRTLADLRGASTRPSRT